MKKININTTKNYIKIIEKKIPNKKKGLPNDVFLFASRIMPMINVDLLIKDKKLGTLLTWRKKGEKYPAGWHVPGGIIRFKEKASERVKKVAKLELGSRKNLYARQKQRNLYQHYFLISSPHI